MARIKLHSEQVHSMNRDRLHARVTEIEAQYPGSEVKVRRLPNYGHGYTISVHGEGAPTSIQKRGHCQFCGNHQVVKEGVLVLHGYQRPGHGWIYGRCPGAAKKPLQVEQTITEAHLAHSIETLAKMQADLPKFEKAEHLTKRAYDASGEHGLYGYPEKPYTRANALTAEQTEKWEAAKVQWAKSFPKSAAYRQALAALREHNSMLGQVKGHVDHFNLLLSWKLMGTELLTVEK